MNEIPNIDELMEFIEKTNCEIQEMIISTVKLPSIPSLRSFTSLTFIDFSFNNISTVEPLRELPILQTLLLAHNSIISVDCLSSMNTLNILDVCHNKITSLSTSPRLGNLRASNNPIEKLEINSPLRNLQIDLVPLKKLSIELDTLEILSISGCNFGSIDIKSKQLTRIISNESEIPTSLSLKCPELKEVIMNNSSFKSIQLVLSQCSTLQTVSFQECELTQFPQGMYQNKHLQKIVLSKNRFEEIPEELSQLTELESLDVSDCPIETMFSLESLTSLKQLQICTDGITTTKEYFVQRVPSTCQVLIRDYGKCDKIIDRLYLGSYANAHNKAYMKSLGITHILSIAPLEPVFPKDFKYLTIQIDDSLDSDLTPYFQSCHNFIDDARKEGGILIHCAAGISRSASIVIAYLMKHNGWSYEQSYHYTCKCRKIICPNGSFIKQLKAYELTLNENKQNSCIIV